MTTSARIGTIAVGYGYWGPNLVRNLQESSDFRLMGLCELNDARIAEFRRRHPQIWVERNLDAALSDPRVEAVAIATPPSTHYPLVRKALEAGKHVLVEKPLATNAAHAAELIAIAEERGLTLMPGHTFLYSPPVRKIRELIEEDVLGEVYFVTSTRMNLGKYQRDGVICDLAPHDLSILLDWLGGPVTQVTATGQSVFQEGVPETAFVSLGFAGGAQANVQVSWLAPRKLRQTVVVGSRRMVYWDDASGDESVRIYDRGLDFDEAPSSFGEYRLTYRTGDMVAPRIDAAEPLALELQDFARAIRDQVEPLSNARFGLEVVKAIEAAELSLRLGGQPLTIDSDAGLVHAGIPNGDGGHTNGNGHSNGNGHPNGNGKRAGRFARNGESAGVRTPVAPD
jgi:predicted dehydrogenase